MEKKIQIAFLGFLMLSMCVLGQPPASQEKPASQLAEFEIVSIKTMNPNVPHGVGVEVYPGGRIVISGLPLKALVACAFNLPYWQVSTDATAEKEEYYVEAKPPAGTAIKTLKHTLYTVEDAQLREMLQAMLIDRFHLRFHRETRTGTVYFLGLSGKTLRLRTREKPLDAANRSVSGSIGSVSHKWSIFNTTMQELAKFASEYVLQAPVLDQTGLTGAFDYRQTVPDSDPEFDHNTSFLRFISELGLKLDKSRGPIEILVIDSAAKPVQ